MLVIAGEASIAVHTITCGKLHASAVCWRHSPDAGTAPDLRTFVHLCVQELGDDGPTALDEPSAATSSGLAPSPASGALASADGTMSLPPPKRARTTVASTPAQAPRDTPTAAVDSDGARELRTPALSGPAAAAKACNAGREAHACVTMHAERVQHVAVLGEWLVVCQRSGRLAVWTLSHAAAITSASSPGAPLDEARSAVKRAEMTQTGVRDGATGRKSGERHGGVEWQQAAGWELDGVDLVGEMRVEAVDDASDSGHCLHALLLLPHGRAVSVMTPLPL